MPAKRRSDRADVHLPRELVAVVEKMHRTKDPTVVFDFMRENALRDPERVRIRKAMARIHRKDFLPLEVRDKAGDRGPLPIGLGQTSTGPEVIEHMLLKLAVRDGQRVLEIGTGSGYQTAVLAQLVGPSGSVVTIEIRNPFYLWAQNRIRKYGFKNIEFVLGSGAVGYEPGAPYDAIIYSAGATKFPEAAMRQLNIGGALIINVWRGKFQHLILARRNVESGFVSEDFGPVADFVPLVED